MLNFGLGMANTLKNKINEKKKKLLKNIVK